MSSGTGTVVAETRVVDQIPDAMQKLASFIVRAFYAPEHNLVLDYVKRNGTIKEEALKELICFDPKQLRQVLITLKNDKLLKERQVVESKADGKQGRFNYYFVNYRALVNVTKYKLDHMRQRLETRDKEETHKASFKCAGCQSSYDSLQVDKLLDVETMELKCWRCGFLVEEDEAAGPSDTTRSSLARFNEQLAPLFSLLRQLDGVQLAPHLLEPNMSQAVRESTWVSANADQSDSANAGGDGSRYAPLGGARYGPQFNLYQSGQEVSVHIEGDPTSGTSGADASQSGKELPAWMASSTVESTAAAAAAAAAAGAAGAAQISNEAALAAAGLAAGSASISIQTLPSLGPSQPNQSLLASPNSQNNTPSGGAGAAESESNTRVLVDVAKEAEDRKAEPNLPSPTAGAGGAARDIAAVLLAHEVVKSPTRSGPADNDQTLPSSATAASQPAGSQSDPSTQNQSGAVGGAASDDDDNESFDDVHDAECLVQGVAHSLTELMQRPDLDRVPLHGHKGLPIPRGLPKVIHQARHHRDRAVWACLLLQEHHQGGLNLNVFLDAKKRLSGAMDGPMWMFTKALSHRQKVLRLFKRAMREPENYHSLECRYHQVCIRARFDKNKDLKDTREAKALLVAGCKELWEKHHPKPFRFAYDAFGTAHNREARWTHDTMLDTWSFVEREQYPYYFNKREQLKKEVYAYWDKMEDAWDEQLNSMQIEPPKEKRKAHPN